MKFQVSMSGKPPHKPVDLLKIQELINSVKYPSNNLLLDEANEETTTSNPETTTESSMVPVVPYYVQDTVSREARDTSIFDKFSQKIKDLVDKIKGKNKTTETKPKVEEDYEDYADYPDYSVPEEQEGKKKIITHKKADGLFEDNNVAGFTEDSENLNKEEEKIEGQEKEIQTTEEDDVMNDLQGIQSNIDPAKQMDIESFLSQLNQQPRQFQFDIEPLLKSKLQEIEAQSVEGQLKKSDEYLDPKKFFEFEINEEAGNSVVKPIKRSINWWGKENAREVEKLKNNFVSEFKDNYQNIYKNSIDPAKFKNYLQTDEKKLNDFVDHYYLLNDGVTDLKDLVKPSEEASKINMYDLNIDLKLNKEFEDLEYERNLKNRNFDDANVPIDKFEGADSENTANKKIVNYLP